MSFVIYDLGFLAIFCLFLAIFLFRNRKNIKREGLLILYRTGVGIKIIENVSRKYKKVIHSLEYVFIFLGYCLMIAVVYLIFKLAYLFLKVPEFSRIIKIPPIAPLIPYLPEIFKADYLPSFYFIYWIVVLAITAIIHEFSHGIFAKSRKVKIKSTGFAFLGPFTAFFVEPDEKKVEKLKIREQQAFIAAGSVANLLLTLLFFLALWGFFSVSFAENGSIFNTYSFSLLNSTSISAVGNESLIIKVDGVKNLTQVDYNGEIYYIEDVSRLEDSQLVVAYEDSPALKAGLKGIIVGVDGEKIRNSEDLRDVLDRKKPNDIARIKTIFNNSPGEYELELAARPDDKTKAYLGISVLKAESKGLIGKIRDRFVFFKNPATYYKPRIASDLTLFVYNLIWWLVLINLSVALGNMLPVGIADGGRFFYLMVLGIFKDKKIAKTAFSLSTKIILLIFAFLTLVWLAGFFR